jgi:hypothetical protein
MLLRIEATIEGIGTAVEKGMTERNKSEAVLKKRRWELEASLEKIDAMRNRLTDIKNCAEETREL